MTRSQTDIQIQKLQTELERLREEENVLQEVIGLVKSQLSAVQVRGHVHLLCQGMRIRINVEILKLYEAQNRVVESGRSQWRP